MTDAMLSDLEDFIRTVSDAAGEETPKFRRSDLAEHLTSFLRQAEDGDAEFTSLADHAYLAPGGAALFVPGPGGTATFDEVSLDSDEALPWLEHYHRQGQHPPEWPAALPLPEEPIDLEALAQDIRLGQAAERVEQALEAHQAAPDGLEGWTQEDLDNARTALQEARWQHSSLVSFSQEEADEGGAGLSAEVQAWFEAVEDGRIGFPDEEAPFAFGLPTPFEEGKHPRGYGGRWANKPGAAEAAKAHGAAEKNLRKHEANLGKLAAKVEKLHQAHAAAKAAHAATKKKAKGKAHSRAALEAHQAELAAIRAKGKLDAAKGAHSEAKKEHAQVKKEHARTGKELEKAQKGPRSEEPVRKPAAKKTAVHKQSKAERLSLPDVPGFRSGEVKVAAAEYIRDDDPIGERLKAYTRGDQLIEAIAHIERVQAWAGGQAKAAVRLSDWKLRGQAIDVLDQHSGIAARDEAHRILSEHIDNKVDWKTDVQGKLDPGQLVAQEQGLRFAQQIVGRGFSSLTSRTTVQVQAIPKDVEQRAYHSASRGIYLGDKSQANVMVHEFGHWLDEHIPGVLEATQAFLKYRAGNEPLTSLQEVAKRLYGDSSYRADEMGRKDHFDRAFPEADAYYVGKDYGSRATEVLSMGLEKLYNDPLNFARQDPEFFKFILGVCDGSLRDHKRDQGIDLGGF